MARREPSYYDSDRRRSRGRRGRRSRSGSGYGFGAGPHSRERGGRRRFSLADWVMLIVAVAVAVGTGLSWAARWINPETYGFMSAAGLFMPALFAADFLCLMYWIIRWRWGVFIPLVVFAAGVGSISMFFRPELTQNHGDHSRDRSLVGVMTYNVQGMMHSVSSVSGRPRSSMRDVISVIDSLRPDILCMQEFQSTRENPRTNFEEALPAYHYKRVRYNISPGDGDMGWGNAIYSKFPITASGHIDFEGTSNSILWADVAVNRDTLRVFCAHLQTTAIKASDEQYLVDMDFVGDDTRTSRMRRMVGKLTRNYVIRATQADTLAANIASSPHPVIVCGDFNDTPASYAYRKISHRLRDSFREAGRGYGYTYRGFFNLLRIDYIMHSRSVECVQYVSPSFDCSDHNPVAVKMRVN